MSQDSMVPNLEPCSCAQLPSRSELTAVSQVALVVLECYRYRNEAHVLAQNISSCHGLQPLAISAGGSTFL
jgi:hypothetical protein